MENIELLIGKKVKELRVLLGLSQSELAENAKTSLTTINRLEKGRQFPHSSTLSDIAKALNVDVKDLYSSEPTAKTESASDRASLILEIQARLSRLGMDDLEHISDALDQIEQLKQYEKKKNNNVP